jgi:hypothetical protein
MWPLLCNEIALSYDQEERVRTFQKAILTAPETWLDRHTAVASSRTMHSCNDVYQALGYDVGQRDKRVLGAFSDSQKLKLLTWSAKNKGRVSRYLQQKQQQYPKPAETYFLSMEQHEAANLYILNHRLQGALKNLSQPPELIPEARVKGLSRRPLFESLGSQVASSERQAQGEEHVGSLSRERSFPSSGSLKRSLSEMSCTDTEEAAHVSSMSSEEAQSLAAPVVEGTLGFVREIIPPPKPYPVETTGATFTIPPPRSRAAPSVGSYPRPAQMPQAQLLPNQTSMAQSLSSAPVPAAIPSFLPPHLNIVPEDPFLPGEAEEFLLELTEEDWAIGEGLDIMDLG